MSPALPLAADRNHRRNLFALLAAVVLGVVLVLGAMIWMARQEALREAGTTARNYALMLEARLHPTLRRSDAILLALVRTLPEAALSRQAVPRYADRINAELDAGTVNFKEVSALRVFDANGDLLYSSGDAAVPRANLSDRDYFRRLRDQPDAGLVFSEVLVSRVTGRQTVAVARALRDGQGRFLGMVVAGLDLGYFQKLFQSLDIGPHGLIAIHRSDDFSLVVRWPPLDSEINETLPPDSPTRIAISGGAMEASSGVGGVVDGVMRTLSFRKLERYPFFVVAALAHDDVLAGWKLRATAVGASGLLLLGLLSTLLLRLGRMAEREQHLLAEQTESVEVFRHLFEDMNDPILLLKDGSFIDCNAATLKLLRYRSKQEFLNRRPAEISPERQPDGRSSDEKAAAMIATALQVGYHRFEWLHARADGSNVPVEVTLTPITMGGEIVLHTLWRDISERQAAEHRLRLLANVFERSGEAIVICDRDNRILEVNQAFSRLTGYDADDVRGQNPRILSSGRTTAGEFKAMWQAIKDESFWQGEVWDKRKDGSFYPKWLTISAVRNGGGKIDYYIGSFTDMTERKTAQEKINRLALHDTLTGLPNRYNLQGRLDQALATARRDAGHLALMFIDMDRFKNINDTLGHHVGDGLLQEVATRLTANVRESDVVARLGGDEFVVVLTGIEAPAAGSVADKILEMLGLAYRIEGNELHTTPSIGIAVFPDDGDSAETLMRNADAAMYHAKSAGRNNVQFFTAAMNQAARDRHELEEGLHLALERRELELHYQPQVDSTGRVIGAEALLRWHSPDHGTVSPLSFIPLAEETGLILPIGRWVLATACAQLKVWSGYARTRDLQLAVNVSPREFREADFVEQIHRVLESSGADPTRLKLELTESLVLDNVEQTIRKMLAIRKLGIAFSLDDFGTGYSSLSYLTRLPLDQLKIDRAFVLKLPESTSDGIITQTIIAMARGLGLNALAEGVETAAQREFLEQHGCHAYQGYLFSRPLPLADFERFLDYS
ncbi:MAG: EAL domain-containing protein [Rhodocyclaceae bacterium]|nr:EAL domain-containing protein [Rhodocyclaceae bacterium]